MKSAFLEKTFKLKEHGTDTKTEIMAGITTFMTMAYIIIVNPLTLGATGMPIDQLIIATCIASAVGTILMALLANYPFALAPGMGINAFFAYYVVITLGYSWEVALAAVFIEGIIFILLTFFNIREAIINAIPKNLKYAISVGIGLFIAFIGLKNAGIIVPGGAILELGNVASTGPLLAIIGLIVTGALLAFKVKGALFFGILATTGIGMIVGYVDLPERIFTSSLSIKDIAFAPFRVPVKELLSLDFAIVVFTLLFVDLFDTLGTLIGVASKAKMLDKDGKLPKAKQALFADAIGTAFGALVGTSTVTTYVESASGVSEGGKTGLTAFTVAIFFVLAIFFAPIFLVIPGVATAPALILVGLFMMEPILKIELDDYTEAIPAFLCMLIMPLAFSISDGIVAGVVTYTFLKALRGKFKDVSIMMYILTAVFILKFVI